MSGSLRPGNQQLPSTQVRRIDEACLRFEAAWRAEQHPSIEEYLLAVPEPERGPLLHELLGLELAYRSRKGDTLDPRQYQQRFPEHSEVILAVFHEEISLAVPRSRLGRYRITGKLGSGG